MCTRAPKIRLHCRLSGMRKQHLATSHVNSLSLNDLKKHKMLKRLKNNKAIIILRPDKGNTIVVLEKVVYNKAMADLLSYNSKY